MSDIQPLSDDQIVGRPVVQQASPLPESSAPSIPSLNQNDIIPLTPRAGTAPGNYVDRNAPAADELKYAAPTSAIARASLAPDINDEIKRYAAHFNQPLNEFGVQNGQIIRWVPELRGYARVQPSVGGHDEAPDNPTAIGNRTIRAADWAASGLGPAIPAVAGAAGGLAGVVGGGGAASIPLGIAGAGAAAATADTARQSLDRALAGEDPTNIGWGNVGWQAAGNAAGVPAGAFVGKGVGLLTKVPGIGDLASKIPGLSGLADHPNYLQLSGPANNALARQIEGRGAELGQLSQDAQDLGIDLSLGQKTGSNILLQKERQLGRFPETTDQVANLRRLQNETQIPNAVRSTLDTIAPAGAPEAQIGAFRNAASDVVDQSVQNTRDLAGPAYTKAYEGSGMPSLEDQIQGHATDLATRASAADQGVTAAAEKLAQAQQEVNKLSSVGNVYGGSGSTVGAASQARLEAAQVNLSKAQADTDVAQSQKTATAQKQAQLTDILAKGQADGSANAPGAVWTPRIQQFLDDPVMKAGLSKGLAEQRIEAVATGQPFNPHEYAITGADANGDPIIGAVPNMRLLDAGKRGLDSIINANVNPVTGQLTPYGRVVSMFKSGLLKEMDSINPDYQLARATFGDARDATQMLLDGGVGFLNKMDGPTRQNMVDRVFSGQNLMPDEITKMRGQFASAGKSADWNSGVRSYVENKLADAMKPGQVGELNNVGGKMHQGLWGNQKQADIMKAAIGDPKQLTAWEKLGSVLKAAAHQLPEGSPTTTDLAPTQTGVAKGMLKLAGNLTSPSTYLEAGNKVAEGISGLMDSNARTVLAKYLLTPEGDKALQTLKPVSANSVKAKALLGQIFMNAGITETGARKPKDQMP